MTELKLHKPPPTPYAEAALKVQQGASAVHATFDHVHSLLSRMLLRPALDASFEALESEAFPAGQSRQYFEGAKQFISEIIARLAIGSPQLSSFREEKLTTELGNALSDICTLALQCLAVHMQTELIKVYGNEGALEIDDLSRWIIPLPITSFDEPHLESPREEPHVTPETVESYRMYLTITSLLIDTTKYLPIHFEALRQGLQDLEKSQAT